MSSFRKSRNAEFQHRKKNILAKLETVRIQQMIKHIWQKEQQIKTKLNIIYLKKKMEICWKTWPIKISSKKSKVFNKGLSIDFFVIYY